MFFVTYLVTSLLYSLNLNPNLFAIFLLSTQNSSSESEDEEEIESDKDVRKWGGAPGIFCRRMKLRGQSTGAKR